MEDVERKRVEEKGGLWLERKHGHSNIGDQKWWQEFIRVRLISRCHASSLHLQWNELSHSRRLWVRSTEHRQAHGWRVTGRFRCCLQSHRLHSSDVRMLECPVRSRWVPFFKSDSSQAWQQKCSSRSAWSRQNRTGHSSRVIVAWSRWEHETDAWNKIERRRKWISEWSWIIVCLNLNMN